ncbi:hypothetical protein V3481_018634 [Fusarium oxysporum f. sp. vasinfectum]
MSSRIAQQKIHFLQRSTTQSDCLLGMQVLSPQSQRKMWLLTGQRMTLCAQKRWLEAKPISFRAREATIFKKGWLEDITCSKKTLKSIRFWKEDEVANLVLTPARFRCIRHGIYG